MLQAGWACIEHHPTGRQDPQRGGSKQHTWLGHPHPSPVSPLLTVRSVCKGRENQYFSDRAAQHGWAAPRPWAGALADPYSPVICAGPEAKGKEKAKLSSAKACESLKANSCFSEEEGIEQFRCPASMNIYFLSDEKDLALNLSCTHHPSLLSPATSNPLAWASHSHPGKKGPSLLTLSSLRR